jgi:hypothetical protein
MATTAQRGTAETRPGRFRMSSRVDAVTMLLGTWLLVGLVVDGWAHNNLQALESFFTPWHALFYSGVAATAVWVLAVVGVVVFAVGRPRLPAVPTRTGLGGACHRAGGVRLRVLGGLHPDGRGQQLRSAPAGRGGQRATPPT